MKLQFHTWFNPKNSFQMKLFLLFKPKLQRFIWAGLFLLLTQAANAQVSGSVFRDYNANGVKDNSATFNEPFEAGVTVTAYDAAGTPTATTTDASGAYSFTGLTLPLRIEFTGYQTGDYTAPSGSGSNTSVQFYTAASSAANFGVNYPDDYSESNPYIAIPIMEVGTGIGNNNFAISSFHYDAPATGNGTGIPNLHASGTNVENYRKDATPSQVGTIWGLAFQRSTMNLYGASFLKRHSGFGPEGVGGIYITNYSSGTPTLVGSFDLQGVNGINLGSITRTNITGTISSGASGDNQLSSSNVQASRDIDAFGKVGTISYGDIDFSDDNTLWAVNLNQRALIKVDLSGYVPTVNGVAPSSVIQTNIASLPGAPTCTNGVLRPFALKFEKGVGYLGCICDGSSSGTAANLYAYVLQFNPNNLAAGFTTLLSFPLNYEREKNGPTTFDSNWRVWKNTWATLAPTNSFDLYFAPQPMLVDIETTENGSILLGFADRFGFQQGAYNYIATSGSTTLGSAVTSGDLIKICLVNGSYVMEGGTGCADSDPGSPTLPGTQQQTNDGPSNQGEFFFRDYFYTTTKLNGSAVSYPPYEHTEITAGAMVVKKGTNQVLTTSYDPLRDNNPEGGVFSQGVLWFNTNTATRDASYQVVEFPFDFDNSNIPPQIGGKGIGLGDLEIISTPPPSK